MEPQKDLYWRWQLREALTDELIFAKMSWRSSFRAGKGPWGLKADQRGVVLEKGPATEHRARKGKESLGPGTSGMINVTEGSWGPRGLQRRQAAYLLCADTFCPDAAQSSQRTFFSCQEEQGESKQPTQVYGSYGKISRWYPAGVSHQCHLQTYTTKRCYYRFYPARLKPERPEVNPGHYPAWPEHDLGAILVIPFNTSSRFTFFSSSFSKSAGYFLRQAFVPRACLPTTIWGQNSHSKWALSFLVNFHWLSTVLALNQLCVLWEPLRPFLLGMEIESIFQEWQAHGTLPGSSS